MTTTNRLKLKTTLALPTVYGPARPVARCCRTPRRSRSARARGVFTFEDALFAVTLLVSALGVAACFVWVWL